jgi:hypothetical protein
MNQGKMRKVSTYSFSIIQNSSQGATQVQMSKLDALQVRNDLKHPQAPHVMSKPPSHVPTSMIETSLWYPSCNGLTPKAN